MKINIADYDISSNLPLQIEWTERIAVLDSSLYGNQCLDGKAEGGGDPAVKSGKKSPSPSPRSRYHHACCISGQYLFLHGGKYGCEAMKDFWKLNLVSWQWNQIETNESVFPHLQGHTMVAYKSQIFIFGGTFYETAEETPLWMYSSDLNILRKYTADDNQPRPVARREHTAVTHNHIMYVYGGFSDSGGSTDEFWALDMDTEEWKAIPRNKPGSRHSHIAVTYSGCMWIHGGMKNLSSLSDIWMFNFTLRTWKKIKSNGTSPALSDHSANVVRNNIVLVGGNHNGKLSSDIWMFNLDHHSWRCIETSKEVNFPPISLHTSVIIDPIKISHSQSDTEAPTVSVPDLKNHAHLLPWHQSPTDVRPWTSPAPGNRGNAKESSSLLHLSSSQISPLPDKNNNSSEEDVNSARSQTLSLSSSALTSQPSPSAAEKNVLKIRPASCEGCWEDSPLLERFHSLDSQNAVEAGLDNQVITISDECISNPQSKDTSAPEQISHGCVWDSSYVDSSKQDPTQRNCTSNGLAGETAAFPEHDCNSNSKISNFNSTDFCESLHCNGKDHGISNQLYDHVYSINQRPHPMLQDKDEAEVIELTTFKSCDLLTDCAKSLSSELFIEDLESCSDDSQLRNIQLVVPSNASTRWSSLTDMSSPFDSQAFSFQHMTGNDVNVYKKNHSRSVGNLVRVHSQNRPFISNQRKLNSLNTLLNEYYDSNDMPHYYPKDKENKENFLSTSDRGVKYCLFNNIDDVKKYSKKSERVSKIYKKHTVTAVSQKTIQNHQVNKIDSKPSNSQSDSFLDHPVSDNSNGINLSASTNYVQSGVSNSRDSQSAKITNSPASVTPKNLALTKSILQERRGCERLILLILGGETELRELSVSPLKTWNCYLF